MRSTYTSIIIRRFRISKWEGFGLNENVLQKFVNNRETSVDESIIGFVKCYPDVVAHTACTRTLKYAAAPGRGARWG